ncbi:F-box only protein 40-like [Nerophis lumbriciformis]|uniref:F-box only protein 40-like n=1 Tax=Nerophis lumbriciformis TaxID=546530 RepID=UPI002ADF7F1B|nr:F-box only protein 40-like [Nerophis lumbriciformis]
MNKTRHTCLGTFFTVQPEGPRTSCLHASRSVQIKFDLIYTKVQLPVQFIIYSASSSSSSQSGRQHSHCASCYSRRCRAPVQAGVCCALVPCRLHCGALFHLCKEEGHLLLCPNVSIPCLNAPYGCPAQLRRSQQASHLQACPASVVVCSVEWNRWPANDAHSHPNPELHRNLLSERQQGVGQHLDLALALKDQDRLFHSLKMRKLFPELTRSAGEEEEERREQEERRKKERKRKAAKEKEAAGKTWESFATFHRSAPPEEEDKDEEELTQEEREALASRGLSEALLDSYSAWESMFSMAMGGCREAQEAGVAGGGHRQARDRAKRPGAFTVAAPAETYTRADAPSSRPPGRKDYEYGHVEPMKITTVRTFKVPSSFSAKQGRIRNPGFYKRESKAVDTCDLGVAPEDTPIWEEVQASLLCSLEKEQRGHLIAEKVCTDGLLQDEGTQTYSFLSAPFGRNASLADLTAEKTPELHLQLQVESVSNRHHKASSAFTSLCGHAVQRRDYAAHYKNVHSDIQMCVNGWFQQRCPLAYLGCTFSQGRFRPSSQEASVVFMEDLGCFQLRPGGVTQATSPSDASALSSLPYEVLCHLASFLDSLSLSQLALVSRLMRQVCCSLLPVRGMVTLRWDRACGPQGCVRWTAEQKVWIFSSTFSPVDTWCFRDVPSMSEHLKVCPYYERDSRLERVRLPTLTQSTKVKG